MLTLRQNGLLQLKLDLTNMLPRPCPPYSPATATLNTRVPAKLSTVTCTELVPIVAEVVLGGDQGEKK